MLSLSLSILAFFFKKNIQETLTHLTVTFFLPSLKIGLVAGYASSQSPEKAYGLFVTTTLQVGTAALVVISLSDCHEQFALALAHLANILNLGEHSKNKERELISKSLTHTQLAKPRTCAITRARFA